MTVEKPMSDTQRCPRCSKILSLTQFHPGKRGKIGSYCKTCCKEHNREWKRRRGITRKLTPCFVEDCSINTRNTYCSKHWKEIKRKERRLSPPIHAYKPISIDELKKLVDPYNAMHKRVSKVRGKAEAKKCDMCDSQAHHWAYDGRDPEALSCITQNSLNVVYFSADVNRYIPLCRSCHNKFDEAKSNYKVAVAVLEVAGVNISEETKTNLFEGLLMYKHEIISMVQESEKSFFNEWGPM